MELLINKTFKTNIKPSPRVLELAEAFGLGLDDKEFVIYNNLKLEINDGDVVYIQGQSGSGKSVLLKEIEKAIERDKTFFNLDKIDFLDIPIIEQIGVTLNDGLSLLSKAGLNDAYLLIRKPSELSDGQKYRFRLAKLLEKDVEVWIADEFGAVLDRVTAKVIAFNIQKLARECGKTLIVATTHTDLEKELAPDLKIHKTYQEKIEVTKNGKYDNSKSEKPQTHIFFN